MERGELEGTERNGWRWRGSTSAAASRGAASQRIERAWVVERRALPGTLEVNVLRMVGRCLVCSRLISTWVSSLEPPPSTPSTVLYQHTITDSPPEQTDSTTSVFTGTDIKRLALAPLKVHVRFICLTSRPFTDSCVPSRSPARRPYGDPFLPPSTPSPLCPSLGCLSILVALPRPDVSLVRLRRERLSFKLPGLAWPTLAASFSPLSKPRLEPRTRSIYSSVARKEEVPDPFWYVVDPTALLRFDPLDSDSCAIPARPGLKSNGGRGDLKCTVELILEDRAEGGGSGCQPWLRRNWFLVSLFLARNRHRNNGN